MTTTRSPSCGSRWRPWPGRRSRSTGSPGSELSRRGIAAGNVPVERHRRDAEPVAHGRIEDQRRTPARVTELIARLFRIRYGLRGVSLPPHRMGRSPQMSVHRAAERDEVVITGRTAAAQGAWIRCRPGTQRRQEASPLVREVRPPPPRTRGGRGRRGTRPEPSTGSGVTRWTTPGGHPCAERAPRPVRSGPPPGRR
ncbi:winged helix-turn-helix domain-containing protein [Streptosporangium sp. NPDC002544]|uniref:helix-turn-helix domain-containing protein n=1 Tax=Streptosporangium sp. NPDC002544 TaxID=3154538 RepID=UPI00331651C3